MVQMGGFIVIKNSLLATGTDFFFEKPCGMGGILV